MAHKSLYVFGEWISGYGQEFTSYDPYTLEPVWHGPAAAASDVARAVNAAKNAFDRWSFKPFEERFAIIESYNKHLEECKEEMALAISKETGKPLWDSKNEVAAALNKAAISLKAYQERCPHKTIEEKGYTLHTRHKAHGAVAVLGPFNFPLNLPNGHIIPALLAGNTVLFKPSEFTPLVAELMTRCWQKAGIPSGVFNLLQGGGDVGKALSSQRIDGLFFTGSFTTGVALSKAFAATPGKILALEMGGNNPLVVSDVEDVDAAADIAVQSAFLTSGQRCTCARKLILINSKSSDPFLGKLITLMKEIHIGHYTHSPEPFMGPLVSEEAALRVLTRQAVLEAHGGEPLIRCEQMKKGTGLLTPGLIDVTKATLRPDEEVFGPLLQLYHVPDLQSAIQEANNTSYGLSASLLSNKKAEYELFWRKIRAGCINWNRPTTGASSSAPFGGVNNSGNMRPSAYYAADYCAYPVASMEAGTKDN